MPIQIKSFLIALTSITLVSISFAASPYWPFNTPVCLTSQSVPWTAIVPTSQDGSYAIKIINNCAQPLVLAKANWKNITELNNLIISGQTMSGLSDGTSWNMPTNFASSKDLPYFGNAFQLYQNTQLVPPAPSGQEATGNIYQLDQHLDHSIYYTDIILNPMDWFAIDIAPAAIGPVQITLLGGTLPTVATGNLDFSQTLQQLGLPTNANVYIDLNFVNTPFAYLGIYRWNVSQNSVLQLPVANTVGTSIQYTIENVQVPSQHNFTWVNYALTNTDKKTGTIQIQANSTLPFPNIGTFTQQPQPQLQLKGILGLPFKEGGVIDGLNDNITKLNNGLSGVVLAFANLDQNQQPYLEPANQTPQQIAAWQQNIQQFQASNHLVLISFGGSSGGIGAMHIVQWALNQIPVAPNSCTVITNSKNSCTAILANYQNIVTQAVGFYEQIIQQYKPNGIDLDIEGNDPTPLGDVFTAEVIAKVMQDVKQDNNNFILGLTVGAFQDGFSNLQSDIFQAFAQQDIVPTYVNGMYMALPLNQWQNLPDCGNPSQQPVLPSGQCIWDTIPAYAKWIAQYWPNQTVNVGITPEALADDSNTVQIWPANNYSKNPDQLKQFLDVAKTNTQTTPIFVFYWDTRNDFNGGSKANSYPSDQYQNELASYATQPFVQTKMKSKN